MYIVIHALYTRVYYYADETSTFVIHNYLFCINAPQSTNYQVEMI